MLEIKKFIPFLLMNYEVRVKECTVKQTLTESLDSNPRPRGFRSGEHLVFPAKGTSHKSKTTRMLSCIITSLEEQEAIGLLSHYGLAPLPTVAYTLNQYKTRLLCCLHTEQ